MRKAISTLLLSAWACACAPTVAPLTPCNHDLDCAVSQQCRSGVCVVAVDDGEGELDPGEPSGTDAGAGEASASSQDDAGRADVGGGEPVEGGSDAGADAGAAPPVDADDAGATAPEWHLPEWGQRIGFAVSWQEEPQSDFPVLVTLGPDQAEPLGVSDGADLRAVSADGALLAHEVVRAGPEGAALWVQLPRLADGETFFVYAGNPAADVVEDAAGVWSNRFCSVWHLDGDARDALGLADGAPDPGISFAGGPVGQAARFDGASRIDLGQELTHAQGAAAVTFSLWLNRQIDVDAEVLSLSAGPPSSSNHSRVSLALEPGGNIKLFGREADGIASRGVLTTAPAPLEQWIHVAGVFDVASQRLTVFIDGVEAETTSYGGPFESESFPDTPSPFGSIGSDDDGAGFFFQGLVDEVRISNVARSPAFLAAERASMTGALLQAGSVEVLPAEAGL